MNVFNTNSTKNFRRGITNGSCTKRVEANEEDNRKFEQKLLDLETFFEQISNLWSEIINDNVVDIVCMALLAIFLPWYLQNLWRDFYEWTMCHLVGHMCFADVTWKRVLVSPVHIFLVECVIVMILGCIYHLNRRN